MPEVQEPGKQRYRGGASMIGSAAEDRTWWNIGRSGASAITIRTSGRVEHMFEQDQGPRNEPAGSVRNRRGRIFKGVDALKRALRSPSL